METEGQTTTEMIKKGPVQYVNALHLPKKNIVFSHANGFMSIYIGNEVLGANINMLTCSQP